jgi:hypothetical protein
MRLSASTARATSPYWPGRLRARSFGPIDALYRPIAVSTKLRRP